MSKYKFLGAFGSKAKASKVSKSNHARIKKTRVRGKTRYAVIKKMKG